VANDSDAEALVVQLDGANERPMDQIELMLIEYERAPAAKRDRMRASGKPCDRQRWLNSYAWAKANEGLRSRSERALELGFLALSLHDFACDFRDDYFPLAHLFYAADRIGADRLGLARRAGSLASGRGAQHMIDFAARPDRERALSAFSLHEFQTPDGPEVRSVPFGWTPDQPEPPRDWGVKLVKDLLRKWGHGK